MHDGPFDHEHLTESDASALTAAIEAQDYITLTTVGIDIGSATSHMLFSRVMLSRADALPNSRFRIVQRESLHASSVIFTPFRDNGMIDADALDDFLKKEYEAAHLTPQDIQAGAVILTGEALRRRNARAVNELLARHGGAFVCATASHELEAVLAAHGSGMVAHSALQHTRNLHIDIGGGTSKFAWIDNGQIVAVAALACGGRLVARDTTGRWTRIENTAHLLAQSLKLTLSPETLESPALRQRLATQQAAILIACIIKTPLDHVSQQFRLTSWTPPDWQPDAISLSGGVSEYLYGHENRDFGDIGRDLATALQAEFSALDNLPKLIDPGAATCICGIRATATGAAQFTMQVSGRTIFVSDETYLGARNVPVIPLSTAGAVPLDGAAWRKTIADAAIRHARPPGSEMALAFTWHGTPSHARLHAWATAIVEALNTPASPPPALLVLAIDGDVGQSLGRILREELSFTTPLICVDGLRLNAFDYIDIGQRLSPPGVIPVVIKSLII